MVFYISCILGTVYLLLTKKRTEKTKSESAQSKSSHNGDTTNNKIEPTDSGMQFSSAEKDVKAHTPKVDYEADSNLSFTEAPCKKFTGDLHEVEFQDISMLRRRDSDVSFDSAAHSEVFYSRKKLEQLAPKALESVKSLMGVKTKHVEAEYGVGSACSSKPIVLEN